MRIKIISLAVATVLLVCGVGVGVYFATIHGRGDNLGDKKESNPTLNPAIVSVDIMPFTGSFFTGKIYKLHANVVATDNANDGIKWEICDEDIATICQDGYITAIKLGTVTITATSVFDDYFYDTIEIDIRYTGINNTEQLRAMTRNGNYLLLNDIDLEEMVWSPMFNTVANSFIGTLNGNGFTLSNYTINMTSINHFRYGFFGEIGTGGNVRDLTLENFSVFQIVSSTSPRHIYFGAIAGRNSGTVTNVNIDSDFFLNMPTMGSGNFNARASKNVGGIVGLNLAQGIVQDSSVIGEMSTRFMAVEGVINVGGIVGSNNGTIRGCWTNVEINIELLQRPGSGNLFWAGPGTSAVGGIVGRVSAGHIENCFALGNISEGTTTGHALSRIIGGFVGIVLPENNANPVIKNGFSMGNITGVEVARIRLGGFAGDIFGGQISNVFTGGNILFKDTRHFTAPHHHSIGGFVAGTGAFPVSETSFRLNSQSITIQGPTPQNINGAPNTFGTGINAEDMDEHFFTQTLGWSSKIWDLSDIDISSGQLPMLL